MGYRDTELKRQLENINIHPIPIQTHLCSLLLHADKTQTTSDVSEIRNGKVLLRIPALTILAKKQN